MSPQSPCALRVGGGARQSPTLARLTDAVHRFRRAALELTTRRSQRGPLYFFNRLLHRGANSNMIFFAPGCPSVSPRCTSPGPQGSATLQEET